MACLSCSLGHFTSCPAGLQNYSEPQLHAWLFCPPRLPFHSSAHMPGRHKPPLQPHACGGRISHHMHHLLHGTCSAAEPQGTAGLPPPVPVCRRPRTFSLYWHSPQRHCHFSMCGKKVALLAHCSNVNTGHPRQYSKVNTACHIPLWIGFPAISLSRACSHPCN